MYDPKFEKGVRQKMEGLEFNPSESVWANIEKAIADRQRRRRAFYFWRFAIPGMLLAGAVSLLYLVVRPVGAPSKESKPARTVSSAPAPTTGDGLSRDAAESAGGAASPAANPDEAPGSAGPTMTHPAPARSEAAVVDATHAREANNGAAVKRRTSVHRFTPDGKDEAQESGKQEAIRETVGGENREAALIAAYFYQPPLEGQRTAASIKAGRLPAKSTIVTLRRLEKPKRPWEAGFAGGAGISRLNELRVSSTSDALSTGLYNIVNAASAANKRYISDIRSDASFLLGIYLQKPLSSRWTVNLGMNLHYYSTQISIGEPVNTYVPVSASLIAPTVAPASQTTTAFIAGDRQVFTNHYYFLELPVNVQYRLNKSRMLPLFLEGGFSLSRLMGSDAMLYNTHTGVYYKDPSVLQKTQFNVSSALMVGLPFHGIRIELGPQVQYGLTPLVDNPTQGDQHFLYTGVRVIVLPGRK